MNLATLFVIALVALIGGLVLWKRSRRSEAAGQSMKTVSMILVAVGAVGTIFVVVDFVMFLLVP